MAEYIAFDPNVEVTGQSALSVIEAAKRLGIDIIPLLTQYGLHPIEADQWYDQQAYLNVYQELAQRSVQNLVAIGIKVPDIAEFPPNINSIDDALQLLDQAYQMNHRGGEIGHYYYERTGERSAKMICHNPYPSHFDYGLIYRIVQKYRPEDSSEFLVELDAMAPNRTKGADSCTYLIQW